MADYLEVEKFRHREESIRLTVLQIESEWEVQKAANEEYQIRSLMNSLYEEQRTRIENKQCELLFLPLDYQLFCLQQKLDLINQEMPYLIQRYQDLLNRISEEERAESELSKLIAAQRSNDHHCHQQVDNYQQELADFLELFSSE